MTKKMLGLDFASSIRYIVSSVLLFLIPGFGVRLEKSGRTARGNSVRLLRADKAEAAPQL